MTPLQTAQELVTVLEQLATLETRREQLIAALVGEDKPGPTQGQPNKHIYPDGHEALAKSIQPITADAGNGDTNLKQPESTVTLTTQKDIVPPNAVAASEELNNDLDKAIRTSEEILADPSMGSRTPEEQTKIETEAMDVYEANVDPATTAQKKMIFGILSKQFGIKGDDELKQAIIALVAHQHHGVRLESISKELSKAWAGDVIDYLESGPSTKEVMEIIKKLKDVPF